MLRETVGELGVPHGVEPDLGVEQGLLARVGDVGDEAVERARSVSSGSPDTIVDFRSTATEVWSSTSAVNSASLLAKCT